MIKTNGTYLQRRVHTEAKEVNNTMTRSERGRSGLRNGVAALVLRYFWELNRYYGKKRERNL